MENMDKGLTVPMENWWIWKTQFKTQFFWVHQFSIASSPWKSVKIYRVAWMDSIFMIIMVFSKFLGVRSNLFNIVHPTSLQVQTTYLILDSAFM